MANLLFKYHHPSRGREGDNNTWSIEDLDSGEIILTDHIELKVAVSTEEKQLGKGFGMTVKNVRIEIREHEKIGKYVVILTEN